MLDPAGIPIATGTNEEHSPLVVPTGQGALVAWWDSDSTSYDGENVARLRATRVSPAGAALDTPALTLATRELPVDVTAAPGAAGSALFLPGDSETLVAYSHFLDGAPYGAERVRFKRVVPSDQPVCQGDTYVCGDDPVDPGAPSDPAEPPWLTVVTSVTTTPTNLLNLLECHRASGIAYGRFCQLRLEELNFLDARKAFALPIPRR